jgi:hypothetical protein
VSAKVVQPSRSPYLLAYHTISCNGVLSMDNELFTFWSVLLLFQIRTIPILFGEENSRYLRNLISIWTTNPFLSQSYKNNMPRVSMFGKFSNPNGYRLNNTSNFSICPNTPKTKQMGFCFIISNPIPKCRHLYNTSDVLNPTYL